MEEAIQQHRETVRWAFSTSQPDFVMSVRADVLAELFRRAELAKAERAKELDNEELLLELAKRLRKK